MSIEVKQYPAGRATIHRAEFEDADGDKCCVEQRHWHPRDGVLGIKRQWPEIRNEGHGLLTWDATVRVDPKTAIELAILLTRFARTGSLELVDGDDVEEDAEAEVRRIASRDMRREPEVDCGG